MIERFYSILKTKRVKGKGVLEEPGIEVRRAVEAFQEEEGIRGEQSKAKQRRWTPNRG